MVINVYQITLFGDGGEVYSLGIAGNFDGALAGARNVYPELEVLGVELIGPIRFMHKTPPGPNPDHLDAGFDDSVINMQGA